MKDNREPGYGSARTGGQILVEQLRIHGVRHVFCVPGESFLAVLDALYDADIEVTVCRQEGGAVMMAEAHGKLTGRPAAAFVTRGPGATNAAAGVHIASHDSTPLLVFVGQIERGVRERGALQELDYRATYGPLAKWATEIEDARRIPEVVSRAVYTSMSGRPGPVVIGLPEDMLVDVVECTDGTPAKQVEAYPAPEQMQEIESLLNGAKRPFVVVGGTRWNQDACNAIATWARENDVPVAVSLRRQMLFPVSNPSFVGDLGFGANPQLVEQVKQADLILLVGSRMSEVPSQGYTLLDIPVPQQKLVHVFPDPAELGKVYSPEVAVCATPVAFVKELAQLKLSGSASRSAYRADLRKIWERWSDTSSISSPGALQMAKVIDHLNETLPSDAILCNGAGNYATWVHRFYRFNQYATQLAPTSGSMGYGVPAAVGAQRLYPDRTVVAFAGDGCFLMHGQEFATAVQYGLPIIVVVVDNGMFGTIRMHQERDYPERVVGTALQNPDFCAYAEAFGGHGERVERTEEFAPALERARKSGKPSIIHCIIDPEAISPAFTLSEVREKALARQASGV